MPAGEAREILLNAAAFFKTQNAGYKSWGSVTVLQIAIKIGQDIFVTDEKKSIEEITAADIQMNSNSFFQQLFAQRKNIEAILITQQQFAAQVKKEIPPILDDQAQLLGVTVRIAKSSGDVFHALNNRYAAILPDGKSICIGSNIEEAFVAAQLLEKTSKAFVEAEFLGGAKSINKIEAWLMQKFYQFKYSKEAKKNK